MATVFSIVIIMMMMEVAVTVNREAKQGQERASEEDEEEGGDGGEEGEEGKEDEEKRTAAERWRMRRNKSKKRITSIHCAAVYAPSCVDAPRLASSRVCIRATAALPQPLARVYNAP